jgi:signal transduction histidine kinase
LGLSLVRQIIEAHGSMLEVQSVEGRGSTFKFPLLAVAGAK